MRFIVIALCLSTLLACSQKTADVLVFEDNKKQVVTYPTELRGAYVIPKDGALKVCAEPVPDVAVQELSRLAAKGGYKTIEGEVDLNFVKTIVELSGRNSTVLLARDLLYRACEAGVNGYLTDPGYQRIYDSVVDLVRDLGKAEIIRAQMGGVSEDMLKKLVTITEDRGTKIGAIIKAVDKDGNGVVDDAQLEKIASALPDEAWRSQFLNTFKGSKTDALQQELNSLKYDPFLSDMLIKL